MVMAQTIWMFSNQQLHVITCEYFRNPTRISHALRMLLKEPQNNLRLFKVSWPCFPCLAHWDLLCLLLSSSNNARHFLQNDESVHSDVRQGFTECIGPYFTSTTEFKNASQKRYVVFDVLWYLFSLFFLVEKVHFIMVSEAHFKYYGDFQLTKTLRLVFKIGWWIFNTNTPKACRVQIHDFYNCNYVHKS